MTAITATVQPEPATRLAHPAPPAAAGSFAAVLAGRLGAAALASGQLAAGSSAAAWPTVTLGEMLATGQASLSRAPVAAAGLLATAGDEPDAGLAGAGQAVVEAAQRYLGVPYLWGGDDPARGLDCSGLVQRAFADLGVRLPRVSADQARAGEAVPSLAEARPGDLVFWRGRGGRPNHIGMYIGDGRMIHAPRRGDVVRVDAVRAAAPDAIRRVL